MTIDLYTLKALPTYDNPFPLAKSPLIQCLTNTVTVESVANALLYVGAAPVMADQAAEMEDFFNQNDGALINIGSLSPEKIRNILLAARTADETDTPFVLDIVGASASPVRNDLAQEISASTPDVIKGNLSEMRTFCGLGSTGRGVDAGADDQSEAALVELGQAMQEWVSEHVGITLLATGPVDVVADASGIYYLKNGVDNLGRFTGTGDIVGALITALLGAGQPALEAVILAVSYFNLCGEKADATTHGLADFRQATLNNLSLLLEDDGWVTGIKGGQL
ncbi:hydroxyethylthiazole kinase [Aerococcus urinaeequi]|uniref:hydroxyethylthiazole kinase n=1 Tax=Aerococcus urinaeequi TaxID=51665 RepID=UPI003B39FF4E